MTTIKFVNRHCNYFFKLRILTMHPCHQHNQIVGLKQLVNCYNKNGGRLICFPVESDSIEVIKDPKSFHNKLKRSINSSSKRIVLSSLYLGTGRLEKELINILKKRLQLISDLRVNILVDYNRGQRLNQHDDPKSSSKGLLQDLVNRANIYFFLSPAFCSYFHRHLTLPLQFVNECISLQHIKCYIFDDNLIISGANLSADYFTNRQDRYIYVHNCPELCNYLESVVNLIGRVGFKLTVNGQLTTDSSDSFNPFDREKFIKTFKDNLTQIQSKYLKLDEFSVTKVSGETLIVPTIQMKYLQVTEDFDLTSTLFNLARHSSRVNHLVSGYFNLTKDYIDHLTQLNVSTRLNVLAASEEVNGFYKANGFKYLIPKIYTDKSKHFLEIIKQTSANIQFYTYSRPNWTFHAKGFWTYLDDDSYVTSIGSSNYGYRSVERDLEMQFLIVTKDSTLIDKLEKERKQLWKFASPILDHNNLPPISLGTKLISSIFGSYF
ncbi:CDP-diacylglycerol--glycerol-3-phosphate 3-phosphatidyltransferase, mitochondrial-like [Panonychus citri]|uniref:CDP-diacylglycerol--glycerol-3-phosphate 3-phosphatidyltransferase, mitochondrial-like n=1 Tax=Panonychus citri TaxID=50023 RepID=UPI002307E80E|nr:CDP-diacylglycerol--glycerol-3-phosphate 3-phosphatidyltransferase, mitochondrial-like [Panonychus citri]